MHRGVGGDDRERLQAVSDEDEAGKSLERLSSLKGSNKMYCNSAWPLRRVVDDEEEEERLRG